MKKSLALLAVAAFVLSGATAQAFFDGSVWVSNNNSASVSNNVNISAFTGGNTANGGTANNSVDGGLITNSDDTNSTSNGGNTAGGGSGGGVSSGDANVAVLIDNTVNTTDVEVALPVSMLPGELTEDVLEELGGFTDAVLLTAFDQRVATENENSLSLDNNVSISVDTGDNHADGAPANNSVTAGSIDSSDDENSTFNGGNTAAAGGGDTAISGIANISADIVQILNSTIVRITRS
jgi:hypothetical protein